MATQKKKWGWGGWRPGAGRKPKGEVAGVVHEKRPPVPPQFPVYILLRFEPALGSLRVPVRYEAIEEAFLGGRERFGFRLNAYRLDDHLLHLIVEGSGSESISRGVKGLCIRISRYLNPVLGRKGRIYADRWEAHILHSPSEVKAALAKLRLDENDPYSSAAPRAYVSPPRTQLLKGAL